jgi:hypothetical protein
MPSNRGNAILRQNAPKLVRLECELIKGDDDNIRLHYEQHDDNHNHWIIVSKIELRHMLRRMARHVEDPEIWIAIEEAIRKKIEEKRVTIAGPQYWKYNGQTLSELRDETSQEE